MGASVDQVHWYNLIVAYSRLGDSDGIQRTMKQARVSSAAKRQLQGLIAHPAQASLRLPPEPLVW